MKLALIRKELSVHFSQAGFFLVEGKFVREKYDFYQLININKSKTGNDLLVSFGYNFPELSSNGNKIPEEYDCTISNSVQSYLQDSLKRRSFVAYTSNFDGSDLVMEKRRLIDLYKFLNNELISFLDKESNYQSLYLLSQSNDFYNMLLPNKISKDDLKSYFERKSNT